MYRQPDRAALAGEGPGDALMNPPAGAGAEAKTPGEAVALYSPLQFQGAFLHQIQQVHAPALVFLGD